MQVITVKPHTTWQSATLVCTLQLSTEIINDASKVIKWLFTFKISLRNKNSIQIEEMFEDQKAIYFTFFIYTFTSLQDKKRTKRQCMKHAAKTFTIQQKKYYWYKNRNHKGCTNIQIWHSTFNFNLWQAFLTCIIRIRIYFCYYY